MGLSNGKLAGESVTVRPTYVRGYIKSSGDFVMPLYQTGGYQVKPSAVNKVKQAIKELVAYVQANEPGT